MAKVSIFGGAIFNNQDFKDHMNSHYFPLANMQASVAKLKAADTIDIQTMQFGQYQPVLSPLDFWPGGRGKFWLREMGKARIDLSAQPNTRPLSNDEPDVIPLTKCCLLDACVRKCFNSDPPIPMKVDITEKRSDDPDSGVHDIRLVWEYGNGTDKAPTLLNLTMVCPALAPASGAPTP